MGQEHCQPTHTCTRVSKIAFLNTVLPLVGIKLVHNVAAMAFNTQSINEMNDDLSICVFTLLIIQRKNTIKLSDFLTVIASLGYNYFCFINIRFEFKLKIHNSTYWFVITAAFNAKRWVAQTPRKNQVTDTRSNMTFEQAEA